MHAICGLNVLVSKWAACILYGQRRLHSQSTLGLSRPAFAQTMPAFLPALRDVRACGSSAGVYAQCSFIVKELSGGL
jgi:hypothetical protein